MSTLAEFIKRERLRLDLSQAALAAKAKLSPSILSRIESGSSQTPDAKTLQELAEALKCDLRELESCLKQNRKATLRVGFPHSLWSAPLVLMSADAGYLVGLDLVCESNEDGSPRWFTSKKPLQTGSGPHNAPASPWDRSGYRAKQLIRLVDEGELDVIVGTRERYESRIPDTLTPVSRVATLPGPYQAYLIYKKGHPLEKVHEEFAQHDITDPRISYLILWWIKQARRDASQDKKGPDLKLPLLCPAETTAEQSASIVASYCHEELNQKLCKSEPRFEFLKVSIEPSHSDVESEIRKYWKQYGALLVFWWEPFFTRITHLLDIRPLEAKGLRLELPLIDQYMSVAGKLRPKGASFDMLCRPSVLSAKRDIIRSFCHRMAANTRQLREAVRSYRVKSYDPPQALQILSRYFHMEIRECVRHLAKMHLEVCYLPEYTTQLGL